MIFPSKVYLFRTRVWRRCTWKPLASCTTGCSCHPRRPVWWQEGYCLIKSVYFMNDRWLFSNSQIFKIISSAIFFKTCLLECSWRVVYRISFPRLLLYGRLWNIRLKHSNFHTVMTSSSFSIITLLRDFSAVSSPSRVSLDACGCRDGQLLRSDRPYWPSVQSLSQFQPWLLSKRCRHHLRYLEINGRSC